MTNIPCDGIKIQDADSIVGPDDLPLGLVVTADMQAALTAYPTKANNLSDLASASTARTNLGLGTLATQSGTFSGTSSGTNTGDQDISALLTTNAPSRLSNLSFAKSRPVRIFFGGTSIQNFTTSGPRMWLESLKAEIGDCGDQHCNTATVGGISTGAYLGWKRQKYGGLTFVRLRGESTSTALTFRVLANKIVIRYSTESDGASFGVLIDGVSAGTCNCSGTQTYNNELVLSFSTLESRSITINPPASGFAYFEGFSAYTGRNGISIMDGTQGGTAVEHMFVYGGAAPDYAVPIQPTSTYRGFDSYMLSTSSHTKHDIIYFGWVVNDAGGAHPIDTYYAPAIARLVANTKASGQQLIFLVEPGGHFSIQTNPNYARYNAICTLLKSYANEPHVTVVDHAAMLLPPTGGTLADWQAWAATHYPSVSLSAITPTPSYTGDFIHHDGKSYAPALSKLIDLANVTANGSLGFTDTKEELRRLSQTLVPPIGNLQETVANRDLRGSITRKYVDGLGVTHLARYVGQSVSAVTFPQIVEPAWVSDTLENYASAFNDTIQSAGTASIWGKYLDYTSVAPSTNNYVITGIGSNKITITVIVGLSIAGEGAGNAYGIRVRDLANAADLAAWAGGKSLGVATANIGGISQYLDKPVLVHLTVTPTDGGVRVLLAGRVYGVYVTATDFPCFAPFSASEISSGASTAALLQANLIDLRTLVMDSNVTATLTGSASRGTVTNNLVSLITGTTANSTGTMQSGVILSNTNTSAAGGGMQNGLDWTQPVRFIVRGQRSTGSANGILRLKIGYPTFGALSLRGVSVEVRANRIWICCHNGTTLTQTDTGVDMNTTFAFDLRVTGGVASLWNKKLKIGTSIGAPTTIANSAECYLTWDWTNGADAANNQWNLEKNILVIGG